MIQKLTALLLPVCLAWAILTASADASLTLTLDPGPVGGSGNLVFEATAQQLVEGLTIDFADEKFVWIGVFALPNETKDTKDGGGIKAPVTKKGILGKLLTVVSHDADPGTVHDADVPVSWNLLQFSDFAVTYATSAGFSFSAVDSAVSFPASITASSSSLIFHGMTIQADPTLLDLDFIQPTTNFSFAQFQWLSGVVHTGSPAALAVPEPLSLLVWAGVSALVGLVRQRRVPRFSLPEAATGSAQATSSSYASYVARNEASG